jgi:hypothetical protein
MLFKFGYFWKILFTVIGAWVFYGLCGYEITVVTLLAFLVALKFKSSKDAS